MRGGRPRGRPPFRIERDFHRRRRGSRSPSFSSHGLRAGRPYGFFCVRASSRRPARCAPWTVPRRSVPPVAPASHPGDDPLPSCRATVSMVTVSDMLNGMMLLFLSKARLFYPTGFRVKSQRFDRLPSLYCFPAVSSFPFAELHASLTWANAPPPRPPPARLCANRGEGPPRLPRGGRPRIISPCRLKRRPPPAGAREDLENRILRTREFKLDEPRRSAAASNEAAGRRKTKQRSHRSVGRETVGPLGGRALNGEFDPGSG